MVARVRSHVGQRAHQAALSLRECKDFYLRKYANGHALHAGTSSNFRFYNYHRPHRPGPCNGAQVAAPTTVHCVGGIKPKTGGIFRLSAGRNRYNLLNTVHLTGSGRKGARLHCRAAWVFGTYTGRDADAIRQSDKFWHTLTEGVGILTSRSFR